MTTTTSIFSTPIEMLEQRALLSGDVITINGIPITDYPQAVDVSPPPYDAGQDIISPHQFDEAGFKPVEWVGTGDVTIEELDAASSASPEPAGDSQLTAFDFADNGGEVVTVNGAPLPSYGPPVDVSPPPYDAGQDIVSPHQFDEAGFVPASSLFSAEPLEDDALSNLFS